MRSAQHVLENTIVVAMHVYKILRALRDGYSGANCAADTLTHVLRGVYDVLIRNAFTTRYEHNRI